METKFPPFSDRSFLITEEQLGKLVDVVIQRKLQNQNLIVSIPNDVTKLDDTVVVQVEHSFVEIEGEHYTAETKSVKGDIFSMIKDVIDIENIDGYETVEMFTSVQSLKAFVCGKLFPSLHDRRLFRYEWFVKSFDELLKDLFESSADSETVLAITFQNDTLVDQASISLEFVESSKVTNSVGLTLT